MVQWFLHTYYILGFCCDEQGQFVTNIYSAESWGALLEREICIIEQYSEYDVPFTNGTKVIMLIGLSVKVDIKRLPGPDTIRTNILFSNSKWVIPQITNRNYTKKHMCIQRKNLFPQKWLLRYLN